jgi:uncharacterized protein YegL
MADFTIECFQNEYLPEGASQMHAVITVTASGSTGAASWTPNRLQDRAEIIILDTSGSMQGERLQAAKVATSALIDCLPEGVRFAIVTGDRKAKVAYPPSPPLAESTEPTRRVAKEALKKLDASGGTAISTWIELVTDLVRDEPGQRHAILLTDGRNEHDEDGALERALAAATGVFECDCRGVGGEWDVHELRKIATALLGSYDIVAQPEQLTADFTAMLERALGRQIGSVALQVRTTQGGGVDLLKQLEPDIDLTSSRIEVDPIVGQYQTGSWGDEIREFHLCVRVPPGAVGEPARRAAQVTVLVDGEKVGQVPVLAVWTDDAARSTRMNPRVADALGASEMAAEAEQGFDAWRRDDMERAARHLGKAVQLADASGNEDMLGKLSKVVDWEDPATGLVKPRREVEPEDLLDAEVASAKTHRTPKSPRPGTAGDEQTAGPAGPPATGSDSPPEATTDGDDLDSTS